eukprot:243536-Pleurochrysis_carterae.AAC.1
MFELERAAVASARGVRSSSQPPANFSMCAPNSVPRRSDLGTRDKRRLKPGTQARHHSSHFSHGHGGSLRGDRRGDAGLASNGLRRHWRRGLQPGI